MYSTPQLDKSINQLKNLGYFTYLYHIKVYRSSFKKIWSSRSDDQAIIDKKKLKKVTATLKPKLVGSTFKKIDSSQDMFQNYSHSYTVPETAEKRSKLHQDWNLDLPNPVPK